MRSRQYEKKIPDENGITIDMVDKLVAVIAEGLATGGENLRALLYCAYREARKIEQAHREESMNRYRPLVKGELIEKGDQLFDDEKGWIESSTCVGMLAPSPEYTSHRQYRRRLRGVFADQKENKTNTELSP